MRPRIPNVSRVRGSTFLGLPLLIALLAAGAHAQQPAKVYQIGYLSFGSPASFANRAAALRAGLRDLGYVEGKNITLVFRSAERVRSAAGARRRPGPPECRRHLRDVLD